MKKPQSVFNLAAAAWISLFFSFCGQGSVDIGQNDTLSSVNNPLNDITFNGDTSKAGMAYIPGGEFMMGGDNEQASKDEFPKHRVSVDAFWMDTHEVTNAEFAKFVQATGYVTTAEKKPDWEQLKKQLPPGTPKPDESQLVAVSGFYATRPKRRTA